MAKLLRRLKKMFEELKKYDRIFVTGPQRSGTRICAKIIADSTGFKYIDEKEFNTHNRKKLLSIASKIGIVIQCPAMCHVIHKLTNNILNIKDMVIIMKRPIREIIASQKRIGWDKQRDGKQLELKKYPEKEGVIARIKYKHLEKQKKEIKNWQEVKYHSLSHHPMWVDKENRKEFKKNQTKIKEGK